jgi:hypothetical protein
MQADAAKDAAAMQVAGGDRALAESRRTYEQGREDARPYRETGYTALQDITKRMPLFTSQFGDEQMAQYLDPSMEFRRKLGEQTTARMLNVGGGAISGNTLRGLEDLARDWHLPSTATLLIGSRTSEPTSTTPWPILRAWVNKRLIQASRQAKLCRKSDWAYYWSSGCAGCGRSWGGQCLLGRSRERRKYDVPQFVIGKSGARNCGNQYRSSSNQNVWFAMAELHLTMGAISRNRCPKSFAVFLHPA